MELKSNHPVLDSLLASGAIWIEDESYRGKASDLTEIEFGLTGFEDSTEEYLKDHPSPKDW